LKHLYFASLLAVIFSTPALAQGLFSYGGKTYTDKDLSPAQQQQIFEIAMQNFEQTKSAVDSFIFDLYVEEEAKKQNKSRADVEKKLLEVKEPSDKALKAWYESNKSRIPPTYQFDQIKGEIAKIVSQEEMKRKRDDLLEKIRKSKKVTVALTAPSAPVVSVNVEGFPAKGKEGAKVTLVEFADFQCPHCKQASESLKKVTDKFKDKVRYVFLDFPINPSGISKAVAEGSHCAAEQGKYWEYHYKAFDGQSTLDKETPLKLAKELKLDEAKFKSCFDGTKGKAIVEKGRMEGERIGVSGTPYLLINGRRYMGTHTYEAIVKEVETSLK
jgi:protein-disulfide isomerase